MIHAKFRDLKQGDIFFFNEVHNWGEPEILWNRVVDISSRYLTDTTEVYTHRIGRPKAQAHLCNGEPSCGVQYEILLNHKTHGKKISDHGDRPVVIFKLN